MRWSGRAWRARPRVLGKNAQLHKGPLMSFYVLRRPLMLINKQFSDRQDGVRAPGQSVSKTLFESSQQHWHKNQVIVCKLQKLLSTLLHSMWSTQNFDLPGAGYSVRLNVRSAVKFEGQQTEGDSSRLSRVIRNHQVKSGNWWNWTVLTQWPSGGHVIIINVAIKHDCAGNL